MDEKPLATAETYMGMSRAKAAMWLSVFAIFISSLCGVSSVITLNTVLGQTSQGAKAKTVLCAIKRYENETIANSQAYLKKHPNGAPALHLNRAYFERANAKAQAFVQQFDSLSCRP